MTLLMQTLSPATLRLLALALLHFLWQGAALAALAYVVMAMCHTAASRYAVGVTVLALMLAAPVATFLVFRTQEQVAPPTASNRPIVETAPSPPAARAHLAKTTTKPQPTAPPYFPWLVELWFAGVVLLSLRSAGGILLVEHLRRKETLPVSEEWLAICRSLQQRMGLTRAIRYCESLRLDVPAVAGWIRPVVLLPVSALSGFAEAQLEAVIAHELAHIRRYDAFVNLFQVGVETLLFYHPGGWWLGKRVRAEREHCCDDEAVALCGSPVAYAHALTRMAESTAAPQLAMAANRSPLVERIARLLGANSHAESVRGANLSAGVLCLAAALLAGGALLGSVHQTRAQSVSLVAPKVDVAATVKLADLTKNLVSATVSKSVASSVAHISQNIMASVSATPSPQLNSEPQQESEANATPQKAQSYIDSLSSVGLSNLSVDELIALKVQGVTADYVRTMKPYATSKDGKIDVDKIIGLKVQGVTEEYIKEMGAVTGEHLDADDVIGMKVQGVTPEYVKEMESLGLKADSGEIIGMKVQGVTPEYVREMQALGLKLDSGEIIGMKVQGVTPEYVKEIQQLGLKADSGELIGMKVQGVTPEYLKGLQAAGFKVDVDDAIGAKVQGITPDFIAKVKSHGFNNLTLDKLIALKEAGVFDAEK